MRVLYLCHRAPYPPDKGDRIRAFHHVQHLSRRHHVHLVALADDRQGARRAAALSEICEKSEIFTRQRLGTWLRLLAGLPRSAPLTHANFASRALRRRLAALARSHPFDAVVAYCSSMAPYADLFRDAPRLLDLVDVDSAKWSQYSRVARGPRSLLYGAEARRLRAYEGGLDRRFAQVTVTTRAELETLREICPRIQATVVRNGIDLEYFHPRDAPGAEKPTIVFTGQMDYLPNVDAVVGFAHRVLPLLRKRIPETRFVIVGRAPTAAVRALRHRPGVEVTGTVDDIRPHLAEAWVFVAPLRIARGVQNKVLQAMAGGVPVVCSPKVFAGLADGGLRDHEHLRVAAGDDEAEEILLRLLLEEPLRRRLATAARRQIEQAYSWERNGGRLEEFLVTLAGRGGSTPAAPTLLATAASGGRGR